MQQCNCVKQEVYKILQYVLRDHCSLRGTCSRSNPVAIFRGFALWLRAPQILQARWTTAKLSCKRFAWLLHWIANLRGLWTTDPRCSKWYKWQRHATPYNKLYNKGCIPAVIMAWCRYISLLWSLLIENFMTIILRDNLFPINCTTRRKMLLPNMLSRCLSVRFVWVYQATYSQVA